MDVAAVEPTHPERAERYQVVHGIGTEKARAFPRRDEPGQGSRPEETFPEEADDGTRRTGPGHGGQPDRRCRRCRRRHHHRRQNRQGQKTVPSSSGRARVGPDRHQTEGQTGGETEPTGQKEGQGGCRFRTDQARQDGQHGSPFGDMFAGLRPVRRSGEGGYGDEQYTPDDGDARHRRVYEKQARRRDDSPGRGGDSRRHADLPSMTAPESPGARQERPDRHQRQQQGRGDTGGGERRGSGQACQRYDQHAEEAMQGEKTRMVEIEDVHQLGFPIRDKKILIYLDKTRASLHASCLQFMR